MKTCLLLVSMLFLNFGGAAFAGCNPCICGSGGGAPPPTGCEFGPWSGQVRLDSSDLRTDPPKIADSRLPQNPPATVQSRHTH